MEDSDSEWRSPIAVKRREEFKVFTRFVQEGASFCDWNPIRLNKISREFGEVRSAKTLRNGSLLIMCKDGGQQRRAIRISKIHGREVQCTLARSRKLVKGVVTGKPVRVSDDNDDLMKM